MLRIRTVLLSTLTTLIVGCNDSGKEIKVSGPGGTGRDIPADAVGSTPLKKTAGAASKPMDN